MCSSNAIDDVFDLESMLADEKETPPRLGRRSAVPDKRGRKALRKAS